MKTNLYICLLLALSVNFNLNAQSFAGGDGTDNNPYQISTPTQLNDVRNFMTSHFILLNDIDLTTDFPTWEPIGRASSTTTTFTAFNGSFNGNGKVISGININYDKNYVGFFSVVGGTIKNLGVKGSVTNASGGSVGLLAGYLGQANQTSLIENCFAEGTVTATSSGTAGGAAVLVGTQTQAHSIIRNCYSKGSVTNTSGYYTGGILGRTSTRQATLTNCYSTANVNGQMYTGGVIGQIYGENVSNCYATGTVTGTEFVGGVAGRVFGTTTANNGKATGFVALNPSVNASIGSVGRVCGEIASVSSGDKLYGLETTTVNLNEVSQAITQAIDGKDGLSINSSESQSASLYTTSLGWDFSTIWTMPEENGFPILKWQVDEIYTGLINSQTNDFNMFCRNDVLHITGLESNSRISVYSIAGQLLNTTQNSLNLQVNLPQKGVYLIEVIQKGNRSVFKTINN